jgi:hypothetical protein
MPETRFFERPILNSPYEYPSRYWELDDHGQPTDRIVDTRRRAAFITPVPRSKKHKASQQQTEMVFDLGLTRRPVIPHLKMRAQTLDGMVGVSQWVIGQLEGGGAIGGLARCP